VSAYPKVWVVAGYHRAPGFLARVALVALGTAREVVVIADRAEPVPRLDILLGGPQHEHHKMSPVVWTASDDLVKHKKAHS
jgi:hypothetical protein